MGSRARAILWAQWRTVWNHFPRSNKLGLAFTAFIGIAWYGTFTALAISAVIFLSNPDEIPAIAKILSGALLLAVLYWQVVPLLLMSTGSALEIKKLLPYPIPRGELFALETLLRISTGVEVLIVFTGAALGLLLNPRIPKWAPLSLVAFAIFNLFVSVGLRDLLARLFARKLIREAVIMLFVLAAALPQFLISTGFGAKLGKLAYLASVVPWPWTAAATLALGQFTAASAVALLGWTAAAYVFARRQFDRGLRFDAQERNAPVSSRAPAIPWTEYAFRFPGRIWADPLAVLMEKELRFISRSPQFRLVFIMGFSFGLLIWLPVAFGGNKSPDSWIALNYLTAVGVYALVLLSHVLFWNVFGFDRGAAQLYFLVPVRMSTVLLAKNITAFLFVILELSVISIVCALLRFPVRPLALLEAFCVTLTVSLYLASAGNLSSTHNPKPIDPSKSFRGGAGRQTQALLMLIFPVCLAPVSLAYLARYAFQSEAAFFAVMAAVALLGFVCYRVATESAISTAESGKESMLATLGGGAGPISN